MIDIQGEDGTPFIEYFDKPHSLAFRWDGTKDDDGDRWIDVSFGGSGEPLVLRIPWRIHLSGPVIGNVTNDVLRAFSTTCQEFVNLIHQIEHGEQAHAS